MKGKASSRKLTQLQFSRPSLFRGGVVYNGDMVWVTALSCIDTRFVTNLELWVFLHHLQNNVAADGVANQDEVGFSGNMFLEEG